MAQSEIAPLAGQAPSRSSSKGSRLAAASIARSVTGVVIIPILTFPLGSNDVTAFSLPPWGPAASIAFTGAVFAAAIVLAALSRAAAGRSVFHALLWAILGIALWLLLLWGAFILKGFGERFDPTSLYSQELVDSPATIEHPLPFGTEVVLRTLDTREPVMIVAAEQPQIVTQEAVDYGLPVPDGDYVAVPLTIEVVDPTAADRGVTLPYRQWVTHIGAGGYLLESPEEMMLPGYPRAELLDLTKTGVHRVYDIIDTSAFESREGRTSGQCWVQVQKARTGDSRLNTDPLSEPDGRLANSDRLPGTGDRSSRIVSMRGRREGAGVR